MAKPKVILDSGAYTAYRKGIIIDIDEYAQYVIKSGHKYQDCFNLDSINDSEQSYKNWKYLKSLGADTIPVYHMATGEEKWLKLYLKETDHVAIGAIANMDTGQRRMGLDDIWKNYFIDKDGMPKVKVHGLGLTAVDLMIRYPWHSVDSFTPVISAVWGSILLPKFDNEGTPHFFDLAICKVSDQGNHKEGMLNSYPNLPRTWRDKFIPKLLKRHGFLLGEISYQPRRDRRGKKGENANKPTTMFDLTKPSNPEIPTLANSWEERMRWNLIMWNELKARLPIWPRPYLNIDSLPYKEIVNDDPKTIMYMGVSTTTHLSIFGMVEPKLDILISYAYLTTNIYKAIKKYLK
jgi:hypothetical protein